MSTMRTRRRLRRPAPYTGRVLSRIDLRGSSAAQLTREKLAPVLPRAELDVEAAIEKVRPICADVRQRGAAAVREYTLRFDGVDLATTRVPAAALAGGTLLCLADLIGRTVAGPRELPVGAVMALIGAPVFIVLLRRQTR